MVIDFEIENNSFFIQVFDLFFGSASKSNFGQYVIALWKGNFIDFEIENNSFF
jgi:hypothetical protein